MPVELKALKLTRYERLWISRTFRGELTKNIEKMEREICLMQAVKFCSLISFGTDSSISTSSMHGYLFFLVIIYTIVRSVHYTRPTTELFGTKAHEGGTIQRLIQWPSIGQVIDSFVNFLIQKSLGQLV
jgi:hypothetical protein